MPEGFPVPPELSEEQVRLLDEQCEHLWGPVIGAFVLNQVSNGDHPQEIKDAWKGIRLPVRRLPNQGMKYGSEYVYVDPSEAFNVLIANETPNEILQYWIDTLPQEPETLLGFRLQEGRYEHFYPEERQTPGDIPF